MSQVSDWLAALLGSKGDKTRALLGTLIRQGVQIMATQAQMAAKLQEVSDKLDALGAALAAGLAGVTTEIQDLIDKLTAAGVPQPLLDQAQGISDKVSALAASTDAALKAIPPEPA